MGERYYIRQYSPCPSLLDPTLLLQKNLFALKAQNFTASYLELSLIPQNGICYSRNPYLTSLFSVLLHSQIISNEKVYWRFKGFLNHCLSKNIFILPFY